MSQPYDLPISELVALLTNEETVGTDALDCAMIETHLMHSSSSRPGYMGYAAVPGAEEAFDRSLTNTFAYARALNCKTISVLVGVPTLAGPIALPQDKPLAAANSNGNGSGSGSNSGVPSLSSISLTSPVPVTSASSSGGHPHGVNSNSNSNDLGSPADSPLDCLMSPSAPAASAATYAATGSAALGVAALLSPVNAAADGSNTCAAEAPAAALASPFVGPEAAAAALAAASAPAALAAGDGKTRDLCARLLPPHLVSFLANAGVHSTHSTGLTQDQSALCPSSVAGAAAFTTLVANLKRASARAKAELPPDVSLVLEVVSDVPGYWLDSIYKALRVIAHVDADNVGLLFDCFHIQRYANSKEKINITVV